MTRKLLVAAGLLVVLVATCSVLVTRVRLLVVSEGCGTVSLGVGDFETFPLLDYAADTLPPNHKSYLVAVEPGIKVHVLEFGEEFPVYLQHGNPTSAWPYRKVVEELPRERFHVILPTLVGLGFSKKSKHRSSLCRRSSLEAWRNCLGVEYVRSRRIPLWQAEVSSRGTVVV